MNGYGARWWLVVTVCCLFASPAVAESLDEAAARLRYEHRAFAERLAAEPRALPFTVEAERREGQINSQARFVLESIDFADLSRVLGSLKGWCDSLLLHLNVKTCVYRGQRLLELYLGRKYYQHPSESVRIVFRFTREEADGAMRAILSADEGPYGTSQYEFVLKAVEVGDDVFVELRLTNDEGYAGGLIDLYLNTLGRYKVGFTPVGESLFGNTKFVTGQEGAAERNVVRYMYALRVSLEHAGEPFEQRAQAWFDATERHARQLHEMERGRYLAIKRREYDNQLIYQSAADRGGTVDLEEPTKNR